jgi:hypothetical protein
VLALSTPRAILSRVRPPERYEPLPNLVELPAWAWRRMSRPLRIGTVVAVLAAIPLLAVLALQLDASQADRQAADRRERAQQRALRARALEAEQRPRFARSPAVVGDDGSDAQRLAARARMLDDVVAAILADARARARSGAMAGRVDRAECERFPRSIDGRGGAESDLSRRRGRYACVAVSAEFKRSKASVGGVIGHPYRALVDFRTGRYAYCKITGAAGPEREQLVTVPRACGGR